MLGPFRQTMNHRRPQVFCSFVVALLLQAPAAFGQPSVPGPNVILILTDNASEGLLFKRAFANNPVCSPTRASLLTGLMPSQHGVHRYLGGGGAQIGPQAYNTLDEFATLPSILTEAGYVAGLSGKWHLGDNLHPQEGFTSWVTKPHGHSRGFYDQQIIENEKLRTEPGYLTDFWTDHGIRFIEQNKDKPFFLLLAYNGPYGLGKAMREPIRNGHGRNYGRHPLPSMPRDAPHPWNFNYGDWLHDMQVRRKYAAEVSGIDDGVGRILMTLQRLRLDYSTLILFMADQGLAGGHSGFWGMGDHTRPLTAFDWTTWIPMIFRHKGAIPPGQTSESLVSNYDALPSLLHYLGLAGELPSRPLCQAETSRPSCGGKRPNGTTLSSSSLRRRDVRSIRTEKWKYIERIYQQPNELYHLESDPGERLNVYGRPAFLSIQNELAKRLDVFFNRYVNPKWDLWKGGRSKTDLITAEFFGIENPYRPSRYKPGPGEGKPR